MKFLEAVVWGNNLKQYLIVIAFLIVAVLFIRVLRKKILKKLKLLVEKTNTSIDDYILNLIKRAIVPFLYVGSFYMATKFLYLSALSEQIVNLFLITAMTIVVARAINDFIKYIFSVYRRRSGIGEVMEKSFGGILAVVQAIVWCFAVIFYLDNLGFKITTVIAGLGVGGVAVALAAQTILKDLFSYVCILFDRPFEVGDFIIVGDYLGAVEYIGIKTTRISSLGGEQLIFSNADLTDSRVRNYKRMKRRRVVFNFGVVYQTTSRKLKEIPALVKEIVEKVEDTVYDRAHFKKYGDSSLDFEVVYYVIGGDYNKYMDIQQEINFAIFDEFERREIDFAYPTRTLYLNKNL